MSNPVPESQESPGRRGRALPDLRALEAFVTVCEAGSMTVAAQRLGVSQSAISQSVRALELEHGVPLFDREMRPARPTRAGRLLFELGGELLAHARAVSGQLRSSARQEHAQIRLGCVDSFAATIGPELIRALSGSARQLLLWSGLTPGLGAQLQARELDLAVCTEIALDDPRIVQRPVFSEPWVLVLPRRPGGPGKPLQSLRGLAALVEQLDGLPLIRYSQRSVIGQQIERFLSHAGLRAPRRFEFDATDPLLSLVAAGLGFGLTTPLCLWQSRSWLGQVDVLPLPASRLGRRDFFLLSREGEWAGLDGEIVRVARQVLRRTVLPAMRGSMPALRADAIHFPDP
ncbi:MAG: LysR family transcriptional regulator [Gammaproteobacteria bacterium]